jgi:hypothetical protein
MDEDSDPEEGTEYRWYKIPVGELDFIEAGFNDKTVPMEVLTKGEIWKCEITPRDGSDQVGLKINSSEVVIENSAPEISELQTMPEAPMTEDDLWVEYVFDDRDGDPENDTSYEWLKLSGIAYLRPGLKVQRLPSIFTSKGETWICEVTPYDGYTYGTSMESPEVVIGNSPPVVTDLSIIPVDAKTVDKLEANYNYYDADGDLETDSQIRWFRNDVHQAELDNQKSIGRSYTQKGESWHFVITPNDGINFGSEMESPKIQILNSLPEIRSPKITNLFPRGDEDLSISYVFYDSDGDSENQTEIRWYMNGMLIPEFNDLRTIPANDTEKDQSWHYLIRASDDTDISEFNESFPVTIRNSRPVILEYHPLESDITLTETESYEFGVGVFDMDGDVLFFEWALEDQQTFQTTVVGSDEVLNLQTDYNSSGIYILTVTIQDYGKDSFKITHKWNVTILNNNRPPKIKVNEPESKTPKVKVEKSLRFSIDYSDDDSEDVLHVNWYLNGQKQDTDVGSYTYLPKKYEEGKNTIHVDVFDGFDTTTETWNVTVKGKGDDLIYGRSWDQWSVIIQVIVIVVSAIVGIIGFYKLRKKKGTMYDYKKQIEEPMKNWQADPVKSEDELMDAADKIEKDFNDGLIEDLQYIILNRQVKENLREIRQGQVDQSFSYLPADSMKELEKMLEDGRISEEEYQTFLGVLSHSKELTADEKERVKMQLQAWRVKDIKRGMEVKK